MIAADRQATVAKTVEEELLHVLARQARRVPIPVFLSAAMIAALASDRIPASVWGGWLVLVAMMLAIRVAVLGRLPGFSGLSEQERLRIAVALSASNGVVHGLSIGFFPFLPEFERAVQSMVLVGLCAGSIATTAGYMPLLLGYLVPTIVPLVVLWAVSPGIADRGWIETWTAVQTAIFGGILVAVGRDSFRLFRESFEIRMQQAALNKELRAALDSAETASRAKTRFLAAASHDLRQPIHTLSLFGAALAMRPLDERTREISVQMNVALQGLASQFDALLDISKLDAGVVRVNRAPVKLRRFLEHMEQEFAPAARAKGLAMTLECPPNEHVDTDRLLFEQICRNLLDNAIKYTERGYIRLAAAPEGGEMILRIADSGRGIAEAEQARVFEEFYQLDNPERDRTRGFGLGLAIVKRLADLLGVRMEMTSAPGAGTEFLLALPRVSDTTARLADPDPPAVSFDGLRVLVVDDESQVRLAMKTLLEGMGCRTTLVDGTAPAVVAATADRPDIVVADFRLLGDDNGLATVRSIRAIYPEMPAILLSGDTAPDRLREAEQAGIKLLHKPVTIDVLTRAIADAGA